MAQQEVNQTGSATHATTGTSAANPSTGTASSPDGEGVTSMTPISSLADLRNKAPKLYQYMMLSLAQNICIQMSRDQDRLTQVMKKMGDREPYES